MCFCHHPTNSKSFSRLGMGGFYTSVLVAAMQKGGRAVGWYNELEIRGVHPNTQLAPAQSRLRFNKSNTPTKNTSEKPVEALEPHCFGAAGLPKQNLVNPGFCESGTFLQP